MYQSFKKILWGLLALVLLSGCVGGQKAAPISRPDLSGSSYYIVKQNDTLYGIGISSKQGYKKLAVWNGIKPPYKIIKGQKLRLFAPKKRYKSVKKITKKKKNNKKRSNISTSKKDVLKSYWKWPVKGKIIRGFFATGKKGIDIAGKVGRKIKAAKAGVVVYSGSGLVGYGKLLIIKHNYLYLSAYAHNRRLLVKEGQKVKTGQNIAEMGVGVNAKPSLHFEIRKNGNPVNPLKYLPK